MIPIRTFWDWFGSYPDHLKRPWLIVGKGPTFSLRHRLKEREHWVFGLNDVCNFMPTHVTHVCDADVIPRIADALPRSGHLVMPYFPHVKFKPSQFHPLPVFLDDRRVVETISHPLKGMYDARRLLTYRSSRSSAFHGQPPIGPKVNVRYFSAVAVVNMLAMAGVKKIHTLGVDGGTKYAVEFADTKPLTNGQKSFDVQFLEIQKTVAAWGVDFKALTEKDL